ncbi:unnamed protein product [Schistocephalus solidus]|uniref:Calponin-homology (CH) domain-containing protein n=1 Tax=Schistocephalus solidus TaxID=70667 RepID=A0A3P7EW69_SCHSO|nr:unnamed protein product [Schistocephalus solidus]
MSLEKMMEVHSAAAASHSSTKTRTGVLTKVGLETSAHSNQNIAIHSTGAVFDCLSHLCGVRSVPGLPNYIPIPVGQPKELLAVIYTQLAALTTFVRSQGGCIPHIYPEHLMEYSDYINWIKFDRPGAPPSQLEVLATSSAAEQIKAGVGPISGTFTFTPMTSARIDDREQKIRLHYDPLPALSREEFEPVSCRAWTDLMLQVIKCFSLCREDQNTLNTGKRLSTSRSSSERIKSLPSIFGSHSTKNFQLPSERRLLEICTSTVRSCCDRLNEANLAPDPDFVSRMRAITVLNFDIDFQDGLVLACILSAFIPSLVHEFLCAVKLHPKTAAHRFHNAIQVVRMMQIIGVEFDLKPIDIVHPHPVNILLLLLDLFQILPEYSIRTVVEFSAPLHATASQHLTLSNPLSRHLVYKCSILGASSDQFCVAEGSTSSKTNAHHKSGSSSQSKSFGSRTSSPRHVEVVLPAKSSREIILEFRPRSIRTSQAVLLVAGQRHGPKAGTTMVFQLSGRTSAVTASAHIHFEAECYEAKESNCPIQNPLSYGGLFDVKLIEGEGDLSEVIMKLRGLESQPPHETGQSP